MNKQFQDRLAAGRFLAEKLILYAGRPDVVVVALTAGGAPVAFEVARALDAPLEALPMFRVGMPACPQITLAAVAAGGFDVINEDVVEGYELPRSVVDEFVAGGHVALQRCSGVYHAGRRTTPMYERTVILVDDGMASGTTMRAAIAAVWSQEPAEIIVAVPVATPTSCAAVRDEVTTIVTAVEIQPFDNIARWYADFRRVTDAEVCDYLDRSLWEHAKADRVIPLYEMG